MPKNIVIFSDGTGQEGGVKNDTNIYKLFNMIEDRTERQVSFYDRGIGTGFRKVTGNIGGMGISRNIKQCYRFIFEHYEAGDRIFLFGFSRGAATMRSLSGFIHHFGILPKSRPELISKAYDIYRSQDPDRRKRLAEEFVIRHPVMWARVHFLGCFDTVAALGLPFETLSAALDFVPGFRHKFHNFTLSKSVTNAYHALAIDDERLTFHPVLWDPDIQPYQTMKQVWFCGMHTDVGGGYQEQELSDIPLVWMTDMAVQQGLHIFHKHKVMIKENADGTMHDSRGTRLTKLYRKKTREWKKDGRPRNERPVLHESVLQRTIGKNNQVNSIYHPWIKDLPYEVEPWVRYADQTWCSTKSRAVTS
ncbi:MAG TPA: DUF2235 domain-containing protein [Kiritimatiellia bacterium]|nr:DUF2235 domain-containing protein [Kiritimatiellia bacterium]HMP33646.1 DUF2235 domain-containing protein [Kiritimatiellia bacterium]